MKERKWIFLIVVLLFVIILFGCSSKDASSGGGSFMGPDYGEDSVAPGDDSSENDNNGIQNPIKPGQLTAAAYSDIEYKDFWNVLISEEDNNQSQDQEAIGIFNNYYQAANFISKTMITVKTNSTVGPLDHVKVSLVLDQEVFFECQTDKSGTAYLFCEEIKEGMNVVISYTDVSGQTVELSKPAKSDIVTFDNLNEKAKSDNIIELMFVVDTTGSMGDELEYLKSEIMNVIEKVNDETNATIYLALLFYRDLSDSYVTRYFDFTTNISSQLQNINKQIASGGGDFPEAVEKAFAVALDGSWSFETSTKIMVHVADAPSHERDYQEWYNYVVRAAEKGIRILTVASSGIDKNTEFLFRSQSLITNSHYVYLTDDSGIGGSHLPATVYKKPVIEYLNSCLTRLIKGYHTGLMEKPVYFGDQQ